jgi:hypothetical protein
MEFKLTTHKKGNTSTKLRSDGTASVGCEFFRKGVDTVILAIVDTFSNLATSCNKCRDSRGNERKKTYRFLESGSGLSERVLGSSRNLGPI